MSSDVNILCHAVGIWCHHVGDCYTRHDAIPWYPEPWDLWPPSWRPQAEAASRLFGWAVSDGSFNCFSWMVFGGNQYNSQGIIACRNGGYFSEYNVGIIFFQMSCILFTHIVMLWSFFTVKLVWVTCSVTHWPDMCSPLCLSLNCLACIKLKAAYKLLCLWKNMHLLFSVLLIWAGFQSSKQPLSKPKLLKLDCVAYHSCLQYLSVKNTGKYWTSNTLQICFQSLNFTKINASL